MEGKKETFIVKSIYRYRTQETTTEKTSEVLLFRACVLEQLKGKQPLSICRDFESRGKSGPEWKPLGKASSGHDGGVDDGRETDLPNFFSDPPCILHFRKQKRYVAFKKNFGYMEGNFC